jgi:hypothetical protein
VLELVADEVCEGHDAVPLAETLTESEAEVEGVLVADSLGTDAKADGEVVSVADCETLPLLLGEAAGERLARADALLLRDASGERLALGEPDDEPLAVADGVSLAFVGLDVADPERLGTDERVGEPLAEVLREGTALRDGEPETVGERETDGERVDVGEIVAVRETDDERVDVGEMVAEAEETGECDSVGDTLTDGVCAGEREGEGLVVPLGLDALLTEGVAVCAASETLGEADALRVGLLLPDADAKGEEDGVELPLELGELVGLDDAEAVGSGAERVALALPVVLRVTVRDLEPVGVTV